MNAPAPIDPNRLKSMLMGAKALMNKVETGDYEVGNVDSSHLEVDGNQLVEHNGGNMPPQESNTTNVAPRMSSGQPQYKNMETSKLPDNIKQAMMEQPIPQLSTPNHTFNLEDVGELVDKPVPAPRAKSNPKRQIQETVQHSNDTFTVSETALRGIITDVVKDQLLEFMTETFAKKLTEQAIKKTINTLIKEGKITTRKKKVNG